MRMHYLQHVPYESPAGILTWAEEKRLKITRTALYEPAPYPSVETFDWLVIMGGPMNIYEEAKYPRLTEEKRFIEKAIKAEKMILGICLGAQLLADLLGGPVSRNKNREIGWFPVMLTERGKKSPVFGNLPAEFITFHWHSDTFALPPGAIHLAASEACFNQGFSYGKNILGLQFHPEMRRNDIAEIVERTRDQLVIDKFIQPEEALLNADENFKSMTEWLPMMLANFLRANGYRAE
ncbi:Glutamine amidotransferase (Class I) [Candidatus Zixiibacteriota bacterium]|nr:Glutamine amidotransferase (Class I) [candidate division Zixibacteria bacterium]